MTSFLNSIGKRKKSPEQLVLSAKQAVQSIIDASVKEEDRIGAVDTLGKSLLDIKNILCGTAENAEVDEEKVLEVSKCIQHEGLVGLLITQLDSATLESRKDVVTIFNHLLKKNISNFVDYLVENTAVLESLLSGYKSEHAALHCGTMTRECLRYESLARYLLSSEQFWEFFTSYVHIANFEIASDAFNTLKDLLTTPKHRHVAQEFMERNCDKLLEKYDILLQSDNYITRRRSLKLLAEILLDRSNYSVMMCYISNKGNLKTIMTLLRHKSAQIQLEAFHVFKIFVANPAKTADIESVLYKNRAKLIAYLEGFHTDNEDPQFVDEKRLLIDTLHQLTEPAVVSTPAPSTPATTTATPAETPTTGDATPAGLIASLKDVAIADSTNSTAVTVATSSSGGGGDNVHDQRVAEEALLAEQSKADGTDSSRCLC